jgi:hypothetical protein
VKILFVYKGRYHVRDSVTVEYLSAIARRCGHETALVYDQDIFGVTDNVFSSSFFNRALSDDRKTLRRIALHAANIAVFLDGFNRREWNSAISGRVRQGDRGIATVLLSSARRASEVEAYDYLLQGEPELAFERFLKEKTYDASKGIYNFDGLTDLNSLPFPDKDLFRRYVILKDSYLVYTGRGCPYECSYCEETIYKDVLGDGYYRRRSPESVLAELQEAKAKFGFSEVIYKDSVFALDKEWLRRFLPEYKARIGLPYKCFGRAEVFDDEIAVMLKESGCYCVEFGVQTFNETLKRETLNRKESTDAILKAFSACDRFRLRYDADHLFGIPGESVEDHKEAAKIYSGLGYINRIKCHNLTFYRESAIYKDAGAQVRIGENDGSDFFSSVAGNKEMVRPNAIFEKYFKILPLLPNRVNRFIMSDNNWRAVAFFPGVLIIFFMMLLAAKNGDKRFRIYLKYYPFRIWRAICTGT